MQYSYRSFSILHLDELKKNQQKWHIHQVIAITYMKITNMALIRKKMMYTYFCIY
jgi:hypothetical protein